jgi:hypothetical protein
LKGKTTGTGRGADAKEMAIISPGLSPFGERIFFFLVVFFAIGSPPTRNAHGSHTSCRRSLPSLEPVILELRLRVGAHSSGGNLQCDEAAALPDRIPPEDDSQGDPSDHYDVPSKRVIRLPTIKLRLSTIRQRG